MTTEGPRREHRLLGLRFLIVSMSCGSIAYVDEGDGPPILLLHGAPLTSLGFVRVIHEFKKRYRVIAPDFPGFGASVAAAGFDGSLGSYAGFVEEFCDTLDLDGVVVYLNDASACIGLEGLSRVSYRVAGLVVADTVPIPLTGRLHVVQLFLRYVVTSLPARWLTRRFNLLPWLVVTVAPWSKPFSRAERRVLLSQFDTPEKRNRVLDVFSHIAQDEQFMRRAATRARTLFANTPALILSGQFDPMRLIGGIELFRRMFPRHSVTVIPREGHFPILASGAAVGLAVDEWIRSSVLHSGMA